MNNKRLADEVIVEIPAEEYQADLAHGLKEDEVLSPGRHTFQRGGFLKRHGLASKPATVVKAHVTIDLDLDILTYFKERSAQSDKSSYQAQINAVLRTFMEHEIATQTK